MECCRQSELLLDQENDRKKDKGVSFKGPKPVVKYASMDSCSTKRTRNALHLASYLMYTWIKYTLDMQYYNYNRLYNKIIKNKMARASTHLGTWNILASLHTSELYLHSD